MITIEEIFCRVDDFCNECEMGYRQPQLPSGKRMRYRATRLCESEIITIILFFQFAKFRDFKAYYLGYVSTQLKRAFPNLVSYSRFVELIPRVLPWLLTLLQTCLAEPTGIAYVDSTELPVCHKKRIQRHRVFQGLARQGKSSKGWFLGFKLHLIVNHDGGLVSAQLTPGNVDDRTPVKKMAHRLFGKLFGDKGYISAQLCETLRQHRVQLITSIRKNMKPQILSRFDKALLKKRPLIESVNNQLKNHFHIEHTRHRSPMNAFVHMIAALIAYCFNPNKPKANIQYHDMGLIDMCA